jgi:hypothetical protein
MIVPPDVTQSRRLRGTQEAGVRCGQVEVSTLSGQPPHRPAPARRPLMPGILDRMVFNFWSGLQGSRTECSVLLDCLAHGLLCSALVVSTVIEKSGWVALFSPGWRPPEFQAGGRVFSRRAGSGGQRDHPFPGVEIPASRPCSRNGSRTPRSDRSMLPAIAPSQRHDRTFRRKRFMQFRAEFRRDDIRLSYRDKPDTDLAQGRPGCQWMWHPARYSHKNATSIEFRWVPAGWKPRGFQPMGSYL